MKNLKPHTKYNMWTFAGLAVAWIAVSVMRAQGMLGRSPTGLLVPIC